MFEPQRSIRCSEERFDRLTARRRMSAPGEELAGLLADRLDRPGQSALRIGEDRLREALRLLDEWEKELNACYDGAPRHPVFVALRGTIERHRIPKQPFDDLIRAFEQDQTVTRYPTWDGLLGYCRCSANPVGRLVLYLCGYSDAERQRFSDATCTALQLAHFWQDVTVDLRKDRVYIPMEVMEQHGYALAALEAPRPPTAFSTRLMESSSPAAPVTGPAPAFRSIVKGARRLL